MVYFHSTNNYQSIFLFPSRVSNLLYDTFLYYTILYYTIQCYPIVYHITILYYNILYDAQLHSTLQYYAMLYSTIPYYTILYYTILYYTKLTILYTYIHTYIYLIYKYTPIYVPQYPTGGGIETMRDITEKEVLFMVRQKNRFYQSSEFEPFLCSRYFGEIFSIWTQGSQKLSGLFNYLNSLHLTFNFTVDYSATIDKLETDL